MDLKSITYRGPTIDDETILGLLPEELCNLLRQTNGFILYAGGLHVRGACTTPLWHSLRGVMSGELALSGLYPNVGSSDIPFAQDALGDQFVLRGGLVYRLHGETGEMESLDVGLEEFLEASQEDPIE